MKCGGVEKASGEEKREVKSEARSVAHSCELFVRTAQQTCTVHLLGREPDHVESK